MTTVTISITREQRNAVWEEIESLMYAGDDLPLDFASAAGEGAHACRDWIKALAWRLPIAVRLLDQLGWQQRGTCDNYALEIDEHVARFMAGLEQRALEYLADNSRDPEPERAAAAKHGHALTDEEWAEREARRYSQVDSGLDCLDAARCAQAAYREAVA